MTWRPLPDAHDDKPGRSVKDSLANLAKRLGVPPPAALAAVFANWEESVGEQVAVHAKPLSLVDGVLVVVVDDAKWSTQLKWLAPQVVQRINDAAGDDFVTRLELRLERSGNAK